VPPLPTGRFDVVLLLETLLAFPRRGPLLAAVAAALAPGGRFALTVEAGRPLTPDEARAMPDSDTVWLTPLDELVAELGRVGLHVIWEEEWTASHRATADALVGAYEELARALPPREERGVVERLVTSHRLWSRWLRDGRVRKHALVVEARPGGPSARLPGQPILVARNGAATSSTTGA
jgi:SAM-dependent methyltransferase